MSNVAHDLYVGHVGHAFFALEFDCEACHRVMEFNSEHPDFTDPWFHQLAQRGKAEGWYVPPPGAKGMVDVMSAWCPACAVRLGLVSSLTETET